MPAVKSFEDLIAWKLARELMREMYVVTRTGSLARDFALRDQLCRACVSVMSNIAEGFERANRGEFSQFLSIAKGSCGEVRSQLYVALDAEHVAAQTFESLQNRCIELSKVIGGLRAAVERKRR